jgi:ribosomal protein L29
MKNTETVKKLRAMKEPELIKEMRSLQKDYTLASLKVKAGKQDNFSAVDKLKKDIARVKTLLVEKHYGETNG